MKPSGIVTLLTDFGLTDPYLAMMKGVLLSINPRASLVDITHGIRPGAIFPAARIIREVYPFFPEGTVHVSVVDPGVGSGRRSIAVEAEGHFFVGPDNGLFWLVLQNSPGARVFRLTNDRFFRPPVSRTFHGRDVFAPVAAHLSLGTRIEETGVAVTDPKSLFVPSPYREGDDLCGEIIHADHFGNLISNIDAETLTRFLGQAQPWIRVGSLTIRSLSRTYSEVEEGQPVALINSANLLEISVNLGKASEYVGVEEENLMGTMVRIRLKNPVPVPRSRAGSGIPPTLRG
jgi:S-adenosyl-L-methionine hydrolase (adenosine-forming)